MTARTTPAFSTKHPKTLTGLVQLIVRTDILGVSAAIAFYTMLSLTPIVVLCFTMLAFLGLENFNEAEKTLREALGSGTDLALTAVRERLKNSHRHHLGIGVLGLLTSLVSGSGVISEIQAALNNIFQTPATRRSSSAKKAFLLWGQGKALSLAVLSLWILVLAGSLILSLSFNLLPQIQGLAWFRFLSGITTYFIFGILFTFMFKYLPAGHQSIRYTCFLGFLCSLFFAAGRWGLYFYFKFSNFETSYGALGSAIVLLMWAYYNGIIIVLTACIGEVFFADRLRVESSK